MSRWQLAVTIWSKMVHRDVVLPDVDVRVTVEVRTMVLCLNEAVRVIDLSEQLVVRVDAGKSVVTFRLSVVVVATMRVN